MPNARVHGQIGFVAGAAAYAGMSRHYGKPIQLHEAALCAGVGMAFAAVPDILEPALSPNHRSTAHSIVILLFIAVWAIWYCRDEKDERDQFHKALFASAAAGYITHLCADACTPKGLPLFA